MYKGTCHICKKEFVSKHHDIQIFCSPSCYHEYRRGLPLHKKGVIKNCKTCGKEFYVPQARKDTANFCSYSCSGKDTLQVQLKTRIIKCGICEKEFSYLGRVGNYRKYCSPQCRTKSKSMSASIQKVVLCEGCDEPFGMKRWQQYQTRFCSKECRLRAKETTITKRNGVRRFLKRRGLITKCQECGYDTHPEILMVHHKNGDSANHSLNNLIVLCPNCHFLIHRANHKD
jgi:5-methylcytosine-specific restriction endonuclease McrA